MYLILTNFGLRFIKEQLRLRPIDVIKTEPETNLLFQVLQEDFIEASSADIHKNLIKDGYLEIVENINIDTLKFKYKTNPLENVTRVIFELTTECNFNCSHCRNGYIKKTTEVDIEKLKYVSDVFSVLNIKRFDFIGGEVSKFGNGWLDISNYINRNNDKVVSLYTNGWWLEQSNFEAAGKNYINEVDYLIDLRKNGITHILFSIDGYEEAHDESRNSLGLYKKIISSFDRIKACGIKPRISAILYENELDFKTSEAFAEIATRIYELPENMSIKTKASLLMNDTSNHFSNFIDIGNGVHLRKNKHRIDDIPLDLLQCKAFYRPSPSLRIMANGNLSVCPLLDVGGGYGNIHKENIITILNNFQNSFLYISHTKKALGKYLKYLDKSIFGEYYDHICTMRIIITLLAKYINDEEFLNKEIIQDINRKIALKAGFIETRNVIH